MNLPDDDDRAADALDDDPDAEAPPITPQPAPIAPRGLGQLGWLLGLRACG